ncbi:MAG: helix-turn-helix domain-containing protein [Halanaerobiaceae bacterium]
MTKYYSPDEASTILKVKPREVYMNISNNKLRAYRMGSNYRIAKADLISFLKRNVKSS